MVRLAFIAFFALICEVGFAAPASVDVNRTTGDRCTYFDAAHCIKDGNVNPSTKAWTPVGPGGAAFNPCSTATLTGLLKATGINPCGTAGPSDISNAQGYTSANKGGDTITGPWNVTPFSSPSFASLQKMLADATSLRGYGFIGDGASHPLSSIATFNGLNTSGYTLAQWQVFLPAATALTDEIDWAATQSYINNATGPTAIRFPAVTALFNKPITVCAQSVTFYGSGGPAYNSAPTNLKLTGGTDGIDHCAGTTTSKVEMHDIQVTSTTLGGTIVGFNDLSSNYTVLSNSQFNGWNNGAFFGTPAGTRLHSVFFYNGLAPGATNNTGTCVKYSGMNSFVNHVDNVLCQNYYLGYYFHSTNPTVNASNLGIEDTQVRDSACGGCRTAIQIDSVYAGYGPFNYSFDNMSIDATTQFINAPNVNNLLVTGGNWLIDPPVAGTTWGATTGGTGGNAPLNLIDFGAVGAHMGRFRDMWFGNASSVLFNSILTVEANGSDVQITGSHVETAGMVVSGNYFQAAPGTNQVIEKDTAWNLNFAPIAPPTNAVFNASTSPTNQLQSVGLGTPTLSSCGTTPSLAAGSNNTEGTILEGSGSPTGCTLNFSAPIRATTPICVFQSSQGAFPLTINTLTNSLATLTHGAGAQTISYRCRPY